MTHHPKVHKYEKGKNILENKIKILHVFPFEVLKIALVLADFRLFPKLQVKVN